MIDIKSYRQAKELVNFADIIADKEARQKGAAAISLAEFFSTNQRRG